WKMVRIAADLLEATADKAACAPWTRGNNCPPVEIVNNSEAGSVVMPPDITHMDHRELQEYLHSMGKKELRELNTRLRLVKPKRRKGYKQEISTHQRLQLEAELRSRGFESSDSEIDLLLRGGSIPSGAGLRIFYRNQRLREDDKWRQCYDTTS
ncbi:replication endonuclease, partial [Enterobacter hormaechei]|nr:replication endonuclease [Enterobacter hormaechei]